MQPIDYLINAQLYGGSYWSITHNNDNCDNNTKLKKIINQFSEIKINK